MEKVSVNFQDSKTDIKEYKTLKTDNKVGVFKINRRKK